jgi:two-component system CitB family sensor kinase
MRLGLQGRFLLILCLVSLLQLVLLSGASYYYVAEQRYREVGIRPWMWHGWWRGVRRHRRGEAGGYGPPQCPGGADPRRGRGQLHRHRDRQARRLAHPNADRIGKPMVGDDPERALQGRPISPGPRVPRPGRWQGPSVTRWVRSSGWCRSLSGAGHRCGSAGLFALGLAMTLLIVLLNSVAAAWLARRYKKAIFGFEPEQMGRLCGARLYPAHGARGDPHHRRARAPHLSEPNGIKLLRLDDTTARAAIGQPIGHLLPGSRMLSIPRADPSLTRRSCSTASPHRQPLPPARGAS